MEPATTLSRSFPPGNSPTLARASNRIRRCKSLLDQHHLLGLWHFQLHTMDQASNSGWLQVGSAMASSIHSVVVSVDVLVRLCNFIFYRRTQHER